MSKGKTQQACISERGRKVLLDAQKKQADKAGFSVLVRGCVCRERGEQEQAEKLRQNGILEGTVSL